MTTEVIALQVEVPIACFRQSRAREYAETYPVPPPATVYGMLLALVGEMNRYRHCGTRLAIGMLSSPARSTVIRTFRRMKKKDLEDPRNARPDYQELLTDIQLVVWVAAGQDQSQPPLLARLGRALHHPQTISRFGGLCLGESRDLVNAVALMPEDKQPEVRWLVQHPEGDLTLPYWVDHVGSQGTRWLRYKLEPGPNAPPNSAWTAILAPE